MARFLHSITSKRIKPIERMKGGRLTLYFLLATLYLLMGCERGPKPETYQGNNETLRLGSAGGPPKTLLPLTLDSTVAVPLVQLVYNGLLKMNEEMSLIPDLAKSWEMSEDGLVYTFYLRPGVLFHDGVEMTAEDVAFTYKIMKEFPSFRQRCYTMIEKVEIPDKYTLKLVLNQPFGISATALIEPILPKHILEHQPLRAKFAHQPVGTGPFKVKEWTADDRIILERNPDYYELRNSAFRIPHSVFNIEARGYETPDDLYSAFVKGETDLDFYLSAEQFDKVGKDERFQTYKFPYIMTYAMEYNLNHPLFQDKAVRTALAYAVNIPEMIKKIEKGYGGQSTGSFTPGTWWYNPSVRPLEYDPAKAVELLNSAGWKLNRAGILERDGQEFRFKLLVNTELREGKRLAMLLYNQLFEMGIRAEMQDFDPAVYSEDNVTIPPDAAAYLTALFTMSDPVELKRYWDSREREALTKLWPYENKEVNNLFDLGRRTKPTGQRKDIYQQIHKLLYDDQPALFLYHHYNLSAVRKGFDNTDKLFSVPMPFWSIKEWRIHRRDAEGAED